MSSCSLTARSTAARTMGTLGPVARRTRCEPPADPFAAPRRCPLRPRAQRRSDERDGPARCETCVNARWAPHGVTGAPMAERACHPVMWLPNSIARASRATSMGWWQRAIRACSRAPLCRPCPEDCRMWRRSRRPGQGISVFAKVCHASTDFATRLRMTYCHSPEEVVAASARSGGTGATD